MTAPGSAKLLQRTAHPPYDLVNHRTSSVSFHDAGRSNKIELVNIVAASALVADSVN
jgi:hypothetical protein